MILKDNKRKIQNVTNKTRCSNIMKSNWDISMNSLIFVYDSMTSDFLTQRIYNEIK
jgi:hypothetical protein